MNDSGGIAIANKDAQVSDSEINNAIQKMVFNPPSPEQIMKDFQSNPNKSHPRLLFDGSRLEEIKQNVKEDKYCKDWYQNVKIKADTILQQPLTTYEFRDLGILLYVSRDVCDYVMYPAFVYLMEGDKKYAERAWREMENAINFPDWHPAHFLDTAEMTLGIALGYDWLYDYLNESQREQVRNAITELGLKAAESAYDGSATFGSEQELSTIVKDGPEITATGVLCATVEFLPVLWQSWMNPIWNTAQKFYLMHLLPFNFRSVHLPQMALGQRELAIGILEPGT